MKNVSFTAVKGPTVNSVAIQIKIGEESLIISSSALGRAHNAMANSQANDGTSFCVAGLPETDVPTP